MNPAWDIKRNLTLDFPAKEIVADWIDEMSGMATALGLKKGVPTSLYIFLSLSRVSFKSAI